MAELEATTSATYFAYGFSIRGDLPFNLLLSESKKEADLIIKQSYVALDEIQFQTPIFTSPVTTADGNSYLRINKVSGDFFVEIATVGYFLIKEKEIQYSPKPGVDKFRVTTEILSNILVFWMELRGLRCLHGAAVCFNGKTSIFIAESGMGKSTLAAWVLNKHGALLSDDIIPVELAANGFAFRPGYSSLRISKDQVKNLDDNLCNYSLHVPAFPKTIIKLGKNGWREFIDEAQNQVSIYVLERLDNQAEPIIIETLPTREALIALLKHSFLRYSPLHLGFADQRMAFFGKLIMQYPVQRLRYPQGYQHLDAILMSLPGFKED